jgi:integrase
MNQSYKDLNTLCEYYEYYIEQQRALIGLERTRSTLHTYNTRYKNLRKYLEYISKPDIAPPEIKIRFVREFENWMKTVNGCGNDYTMKNIQLLERVLRLALEYECIDRNPLDLFNYRYDRHVKRVYLQKKDLDKLQAHTFRYAYLNRVRDVFIFCCYTGLAYSDAKAFKINKNVITAKDGSNWIYISRVKTGEETYLPLLAPAKNILSKYTYKLPVIANTNYNKYLKRVAKICGIEIHLCTHTARKTFGNIMHNEYNVPIETVSKMLGHSSIRTTQDWYVRTNMDKIEKDMRGVVELLNIA